MKSWADAADRVLAPLFKSFPPDIDKREMKRRIFAAYPFGPREYWPYKVWLRRVKMWKAAWAKGLYHPEERRAPARTRSTDPQQTRML